MRSLSVLLSDFDRPEVLTYSLESTIAEKFDAILARMELTSRMKDFFDIYYLASTYDFEGRKIQEAVQQTLENRRTNYERDSLERISNFYLNQDMLANWNQFSRKTLSHTLDFEIVLKVITAFLKPIFEAVVNEEEYFNYWNKEEFKWVV